MHSSHPNGKFLSLMAVLVMGAGCGVAGEELMPMAPGGAGLSIAPLINASSDAPPESARPQVQKNVIRLTIPSSARKETPALETFKEAPALKAMPELINATAESRETNPGEKFSFGSPQSDPGDIPGLMLPETLATQTGRRFREDLKDLISFDGTRTSFEPDNTAAYTMPISTATYIAPAPAEFIPVCPPPIASPSRPQPEQLELPPPIASAPAPVVDIFAGPPLPSLDPMSIPAPANKAARTAESRPLSLRPPPATHSAEPEKPVTGSPPADTRPGLSLTSNHQRLTSTGPVPLPPPKGLATPTVRPAAALSISSEPPTSRHGVPLPSPDQFRSPAKSKTPPTEPSSMEPESDEEGFTPMRGIKSIFRRGSKVQN